MLGLLYNLLESLNVLASLKNFEKYFHGVIVKSVFANKDWSWLFLLVSSRFMIFKNWVLFDAEQSD